MHASSCTILCGVARLTPKQHITNTIFPPPPSISSTLSPFQGITPSQAQQKYMDLLAECPAFGSMFFEAEYVNKDQRFPKDLWLAVNAKGVQIYQRGAVAPIQTYSYKM